MGKNLFPPHVFFRVLQHFDIYTLITMKVYTTAGPIAIYKLTSLALDNPTFRMAHA